MAPSARDQSGSQKCTPSRRARSDASHKAVVERGGGGGGEEEEEDGEEEEEEEEEQEEEKKRKRYLPYMIMKNAGRSRAIVYEKA